jgi:ubiquinone/menaquinone biosynthesis C-methylase UbiE
MNCLENWFCASGIWRHITKRHILPWLLDGVDLGDHVLEIGAGSGAATAELCRRARVTSLEYDAKSVARLAARFKNSNIDIVQGDAASLPFADQSFSSAVAVLVLHHLPSIALQDQALGEIFRILRPGGVFLAVEIVDSWLHRATHFKSTFVPVVADALPSRLARIGFSEARIDFSGGAFRIQALRPK